VTRAFIAVLFLLLLGCQTTPRAEHSVLHKEIIEEEGFKRSYDYYLDADGHEIYHGKMVQCLPTGEPFLKIDFREGKPLRSYYLYQGHATVGYYRDGVPWKGRHFNGHTFVKYKEGQPVDKY
jgi:hypothetical protein